ncbi:MAG: hypothetical protein HKN50_11395 [Gammaproteobacteria bacterium]|nr:hypothetical protein [Gammaproteobacteria bacterium]
MLGMKMKKASLFTALIVVTGLAIAHWYFSDRGRFTTMPEETNLGRSVIGNDLVSTYDPALTLRFDSKYQHLGGQKFVLYGVADTEQHFFVETTPDGKLKSLYWVQYEAYLRGKSYTYDYDDSPLRLKLGDYEFYADTDAFRFDPNKKRKRGTDSALVRQFLAGKGYSYPQEVLYARMVYLTDASRQKELMIIFMDDLAAYGTTAADLKDDGAEAEHWSEIERAHLERIKNTLTVLGPGTN